MKVNPKTGNLDEKTKAEFDKKLNQLLDKFGIRKNDSPVQTNNGSQVNNGTVIGNMVFYEIPFDDVTQYLEEQFVQLRADVNALDKDMEPVLLRLLKPFFQKYHDELLQMRKSSDLTLKDIQETQNKMMAELSKVDDADIRNDLRALKNLCEDIQSVVNLVYEKLDKNSKEIDSLKDLLANYIKAAELRGQEVLSAIQFSIKGVPQNLSALDMGKIAEMFAVLQEIIEQQQKDRNADLAKIISKYNEDIKSQNTEIEESINVLKGNDEKIQSFANNILETAKDTNDLVRKCYTSNVKGVKLLKKIREDVDNLPTILHEIIDRLNKITNAEGSKSQENKEVEELITKVKQLQEYIAEIDPKTIQAEFPCPYCGCKAVRPIVNGEAHCTVCGHRYGLPKSIDPTDNKGIEKLMSTFEGRIKELCEDDGAEWRKRHSALLELVSKDGKKYYRMKLDKDHKPSKGVLIIPNKTHSSATADVQEIGFCMPNVGDNFSEMLLQDVKTVILSSGVSLLAAKQCFNGKQPFEGKEVLCMGDLNNVTVTRKERNGVKNNA